MTELTLRQRDILEFIERRVADSGMPPTRAEIVERFGFRSPNAAQCHLRALAARGAIKLIPGSARGIVLNRSEGAETVPAAREARIPIIGRVQAGKPILAVENHEDAMAIDRAAFNPPPDYMLRVQGQSMSGAGIHDGDLLLVHRTLEARNGQIVVARIGDEVTVKRLGLAEGRPRLEPENPAFEAIEPDSSDDFAIEGIGVGVVRRGLR